MRYVAWQDTDLAALRLTVAECQEAVQWVDGEHCFAGHRAVGRLLSSAQQPWRGIGLAIGVPPLRVVARVAYALVKANRSRLVHLCRQPIK